VVLEHPGDDAELVREFTGRHVAGQPQYHVAASSARNLKRRLDY
jgi:hypothetical protein